MSKDKSNPVKVYEYMQKRGVAVTREEIVKGAGLTRDQVRQVIQRLKTNGSMVVHVDEEEVQKGVPLYTLHPHAEIAKHSGMDVIRLKTSTDEEEEATVLAAGKQPLKESDIARQGENAKSFMYQQGYSQGYNDAMFHSHREAYQAGKKVVIEGLLKLLKVDAKVLMA